MRRYKVIVLDSPESHTFDKLDLKSHEPISIFSVFYVLNFLFTMFRRILWWTPNNGPLDRGVFVKGLPHFYRSGFLPV